MPKTEKRREELLLKSNTLPLCSGVYIMKDKAGNVIYVGKSRKLKNRVSQYFQNNKKPTKTEKMVYTAEEFEYFVCKTEIEALTLENTLIKQYSPKYNIKLKDAKSYPYIKITDGKYPRVVFTRTRGANNEKYFGPFSGASTAYAILDIIHKSLGIPNCKRVFPRDIGKERPCIYYQMKKCCGVCTGNVSEKEYAELIRCAAEILRGHSRDAIQKLTEQMMTFAESERYESAARCRDTIRALQQLNQKQNVVAAPDSDIDVFGIATDTTFATISMLSIRDGALTDKNDFSIGDDAILDSASISAYLADHYITVGYIPKLIVTPIELDEADIEDLASFLSTKRGSKVEIRFPIRGRMKELLRIAEQNASEKVRQDKLNAQKDENVLYNLGRLLSLETLPERIEAYDISNIGKENITAGMIVFKNGKSCKADYRSFNIKSVTGSPDDYASMREALTRRFKHLYEDKESSFSEYPDLILVDGGKGHVSVAKEVLADFGLALPVFGMVKDDYHKTRALCTDSEEINIGKEQSVYMLIYRIQEEVHRFTVSKTTNAKRKTLKHSSLENIKGIGTEKAKKLLSAFGSIKAIRDADEVELQSTSGITKADAYNIYKYFHSKET